jgi:acetylornithine/N-succinyldiaminopimelate aminotransferase
LLGLVLKASPAIVAADLRAAGLLVVPAGTDVIRLLPPLNITDAEVDEALAILTRYL